MRRSFELHHAHGFFRPTEGTVQTLDEGKVFRFDRLLIISVCGKCKERAACKEEHSHGRQSKGQDVVVALEPCDLLILVSQFPTRLRALTLVELPSGGRRGGNGGGG